MTVCNHASSPARRLFAATLVVLLHSDDVTSYLLDDVTTSSLLDDVTCYLDDVTTSSLRDDVTDYLLLLI